MNKYNNGFAVIGIVAIIVAILTVGGGAYYLGKGQKEKIVENPKYEVPTPPFLDESNYVPPTPIKNAKTHINLSAGYQVDYPIGWYVKNSDTTFSNGYSSFSIQNIKDAVFPGSDFTMKVNGSLVSIDVTNNMNYSNYEEFIKDPKTDLPKAAKDERIANLEMINIGGKTIQGLNSFKKSNRGGFYVFIYNNKKYEIGISSGSEEQYYKDKKVFENMVASFKFIDSEESSATKNDVTNQPAYLKSVYVKDGKNYISVDYIQVFETEEEIIKARIEDGECFNATECYAFPNGYKRNVNPLIRTFEVDPNVEINVYGEYKQYLNNGDLNSSNSLINFSQLKEYKEKSADYEQYIMLDVKNGKVVKIIEPYQE